MCSRVISKGLTLQKFVSVCEASTVVVMKHLWCDFFQILKGGGGGGKRMNMSKIKLLKLKGLGKDFYVSCLKKRLHV